MKTQDPPIAHLVSLTQNNTFSYHLFGNNLLAPSPRKRRSGVTYLKVVEMRPNRVK